jgi:hypothetical protein
MSIHVSRSLTVEKM